MEESFRPKSWLGIIKGSKVHIDFSLPDHFNQSFEQLLRQINLIEQKLSYQSSNPMGKSINRSLLYELINRTLEQNDVLLKLADRLVQQQEEQRHSFDTNHIIKTVLTMILLWLFMIYCQHEFFHIF